MPRCSRAVRAFCLCSSSGWGPPATGRHRQDSRLEYIKEEGGVLKIGGRTRESALEHSDLIQKKYPLLARDRGG